jgi:NADPH:quinone reductase-like Zn-dependent oxidoreductase
MAEAQEVVASEDTVKSLMLTGFGGYEKIKLEEIPKPQPKEGYLIIEMKACGMNFSDLYTRQGVYTFHGLKPPFVLGLDGAGVVSEVGKNVTEFKVGDRVLCWKFDYGTWSEFIEIHPSQCYLLPDAMTYLEATCLVTNYLTAYFAVMDFGNLRPGQSILIQAAAGGVGWAATQIARAVKDVTIFGTASSSKHDLIKENGVTHAIDYRKDDFVDEVLKVAPQGINVVLDCLSGADFIRAQRCLKDLGRIIHIGISSMINGEKRNIFKNLKVWWQTKNISIYNIIQKNHAVCGLSISNIFENDPVLFKSALQNVIQLYTDGKIKPRIDSVWSFDEVVEATKCMVERKNVGKIVLVPKKEDSTQLQESFQN